MSVAQQRALVAQPDPGSSVQARCQALGLARSSFYYQPCGESAYNLELMRLLDEEFTQHNFKGVLGLRDHLRLAGHAVNEKRVRRLVRLMGHEPVYPKPRLGVPGQGVTPYPYLLRERPATAPNEVLVSPRRHCEHGHYLRAHDKGLPLPGCRTRLARALRAQLAALQHARCGLLPAGPRPGLRVAPAPHSFHSDQGSQFTSLAYEQALLAVGCRISRDGRGRATDNAFIERLWRTVK